ncbi:hypothetical protein V6N12_055052 [Hibiscus sabdariffa]|uniref:TF-B3 domain-containing protein n=1 Tax=Hibiscus sabdariffa TaxID=183260 RepID=A0ABR2D289_9ROSI
MEIFAKVLTVPDLERRLSFSKACLEGLPQFKGCHGNGIVLKVKDEDGIFWNFGCIMIGSKLAMVSGWIKFARSRGLQEGDRVVLHKEEDSISGSGSGSGSGTVLYKIQVNKIRFTTPKLSVQPQPQPQPNLVNSKPNKTNTTRSLWVKLKILKLLRSSFYVQLPCQSYCF